MRGLARLGDNSEKLQSVPSPGGSAVACQQRWDGAGASPCKRQAAGEGGRPGSRDSAAKRPGGPRIFRRLEGPSSVAGGRTAPPTCRQ